MTGPQPGPYRNFGFSSHFPVRTRTESCLRLQARSVCYDEAMRTKILLPAVLCALPFLVLQTGAQSATGTLQVSTRIAPTGGKPEPLRQFTLYILTMSYADILKQASAQFPLASRDEFISNLKISPELKEWMKKHGVIDLMLPDTDKLITPDNVMKIPEFFDAYLRSNSGGVTKGLPAPKYKESEQQSNPARYEKQKQEYLAALRKFIEAYPGTMAGMETELGGVNPKYAWDKAQEEHNQKVAQLAPDLAQTKYLVFKGDTDLDGHLNINGLPAGHYWVSSLGMFAVSGDQRLAWDVPVTVAAGQVARAELSNLNGKDFASTRP